jgi:hypothetical protein
MDINVLNSFIILVQKIRSKLWCKFVSKSRNKNYYPGIYKSYWHYKFKKSDCIEKFNNYYSAIPNHGAGIGHQMANWIAGYWFAKQFGLQYAHSPFSTPTWDSFLGFGENEITIDELIKSGYKKVKLPLFDEFNHSELELQKKIIASYSNLKVVFIAEQDQGYKNQFGVMETLKQKFFNAPFRVNDRLLFDRKFMNIAIHVRRGDIAIGKDDNPNFSLRWQKNEYFINVLRNVFETIKSEKQIAVYLFSQGNVENFAEFNQFENLHYCLDMNAMCSFLHMCYADVLITSKSSFSYKPALLNKGIKICPKDFWHGYPEAGDWVLADYTGELLNELHFHN